MTAEKIMQEAIDKQKERIKEDNFYLGSIITQNTAYEAVMQRFEDARPHIDKRFLSLFDAMRHGVLADIVDAGEETRRQIMEG